MATGRSVHFSFEATTDLDADGACFYHSRILDQSQKPPSGVWRSYCWEVGFLAASDAGSFDFLEVVC